MELKDIVSVSGISGLHKVVGRSKTNLILETIDEKKQRFPVTINNKISVLEDIAVFTTGEDAKLRDIFIKMDEQVKAGTAAPDPKADDKATKDFFVKALPDYDEAKVYASHIKKMVNWFTHLSKHMDMATLKEQPAETEEKKTEELDVKSAGKTAKKKPVSKAAPTKLKTANVRSSIKTKTTTTRKTGGS